MMDFDELKNFIENIMEPQQIYQPVVIRYLLRNKFSSDRDAVEKELSQTSGKELKFIQTSALYDICGVLGRHNVIIFRDTENKIGKLQLNLNDDCTLQEKEELIQICDYKIIEWELKQSNDANFYTIQIGKDDSKNFDRNAHGYASQEKNTKTKDYDKIKAGDYIFLYFTETAIVKNKYKKLLKSFCKVTSNDLKNKTISFIKLAEIKGIEFKTIQSLQKVLTSKKIEHSFKNLAKQGFSLLSITKDDFNILFDFDKNYHNVFLCSIQSEAAFSHFQDTVITVQKTNELDINPEFKNYSELCVWGTKKTDQYYTHWSKIKNGDLILFFKDYYRYAGILLGIENNKKVADKLWGTDNDQSWEQIMYILPQNLIEISVDKEKLNEMVPGYTANAYPRNNNPFYRIKSESIIGMMIDEN